MTYHELVQGLIHKLGTRCLAFDEKEAGLEITGYLEPELAPLAGKTGDLDAGWICGDCEISDEMVIHLIDDLMKQADQLRGECHRLRKMVPIN